MKKAKLEVKKIVYEPKKDEITTSTVIIRNKEAIEKLSNMCFGETYLNDTEIMRIISLIDEKIENLVQNDNLPDDFIQQRINLFSDLREKMTRFL